MDQNFSRYEIHGEISIIILVFILDYFQEKLMPQFHKKSKKPYFEAILGTFCQKFSWKKGLCQFLNTPIIYYCAKNQNKLMTIPEKNAKLKDWQKERQTERQRDRQKDRESDRPTENDDFIGPSVGQESNNLERSWKELIQHHKKNSGHFRVKTQK